MGQFVRDGVGGLEEKLDERASPLRPLVLLLGTPFPSAIPSQMACPLVQQRTLGKVLSLRKAASSLLYHHTLFTSGPALTVVPVNESSAT